MEAIDNKSISESINQTIDSAQGENPPRLISQFIRRGAKVWKTRKCTDGSKVSTREPRKRKGIFIGYKDPNSDVFYVSFSMFDPKSYIYYLLNIQTGEKQLITEELAEAIASGEKPIIEFNVLCSKKELFDPQVAVVEAMNKIYPMIKFQSTDDLVIPNSIKKDFLAFEERCYRYFKWCKSSKDLNVEETAVNIDDY